MVVINKSHCKVLLAFIVLLFFLTNNSANAACRLLQPGSIHFTMPQNLVIPRDAATYTVLYTSKPVMLDPTVGVNCDSSADGQGLKNEAGPSNSINISYFKNNDSVGYRILVEPKNFSRQLEDFDLIYASPIGDFRLKGYSYRLEIVKLWTPVTSGVLTFGGLIADYYYGSEPTIRFFIDNASAISEGTCTTRDVSVDMKSQKTSGFNGGNVSLPPVPFAINLNCNQGINSIKYRLDPITAILNQAESIIALDSNSSASGIGVQILDNSGRPLPLGTDIPLSNNTAAGGNFSIPLKAAYYKIANTVKGGTANASLTYTMNYQ